MTFKQVAMAFACSVAMPAQNVSSTVRAAIQDPAGASVGGAQCEWISPGTGAAYASARDPRMIQFSLRLVF